MKIFTDGSGKMGKSAYLIDSQGNDYIKIINSMGVTSNEAEYLAVIQALKDNPDSDIEFFSDSKLVVNQMNGTFKRRNPRMKKLAEEVEILCKNRNVSFNWIPREENKAGKVLERILRKTKI